MFQCQGMMYDIVMYMCMMVVCLLICLFQQYIQIIIKEQIVEYEMDQFFSNEEPTYSSSHAQPHQQHTESPFSLSSDHPTNTQHHATLQYQFPPQTLHTQQQHPYTTSPQQENDFNQFQEDEVTKRIRAEEERIQLILKSKSEREWDEKGKKREEGRRALQQFLGKKQAEKLQRAKDNLRKEAIFKQQIGKLNVEAGWKKVITNINVRQGERKGSKDINRMRQAILHRRQDDSR